MCEEKIEKWVDLAIRNENLGDYIITIDGKSGKSDGYLGNIFFVTVSGKTKEGHGKTINLAIKAAKESKMLRQQIPIKEAYEKEIFVYDQILTTFDTFQKDMGAENLLQFFPHCYVSKISNGSEILILENLNVQGYGTWDRKIPMTNEHVRLVLEAYGKWHAFSFALRYKRSDIFEKLVKDNINIFGHFFVKTGMIDLTLDLFEESRDACISPDKVTMLKHLQFSKSDANYNFTDIFFEDMDYSVISHGDCWTNNFMFKFDEDITKPIKVVILDWQCGGLSSPVLDLSHFIYACADTFACKEVAPFLKIYYESLSETLKCFNCDPEELFPYAKLVEHWKRFSRYGILLQSFLLKFSLCDAQDAPDFAEAAEQGKEFLENFNMEVTNKEEYHKRVRANLEHYVKNLDVNDD